MYWSGETKMCKLTKICSSRGAVGFSGFRGEDLTRVSKLKYKESLYNNGNIIKHQSEYILMNNMLMNNILSNDIY